MNPRPMGAMLAAALAALGAGSAAGQDLPLGYLPSAAGPFATCSKTTEIAAQIAIDEINSTRSIPGKKLRIVALHTRSKPDHAAVGPPQLGGGAKVLGS